MLAGAKKLSSGCGMRRSLLFFAAGIAIEASSLAAVLDWMLRTLAARMTAESSSDTHAASRNVTPPSKKPSPATV